MIFPLLLIIAIIALFFIERKIEAWGIRFLLNAILIALIAIGVGNIAVNATQTLNRNLYALTMPIIIKQLESSDKAERSEAITLLRQLTGISQSQKVPEGTVQNPSTKDTSD